MPAPIGHTCPDIDKAIKYIKIAMANDRDLKRLSETELFDAASTMNSELYDCIGFLEQMRKSNAALREWGEELEKERDSFESQIADLENEIEQLKQPSI